MTGQRFGQRPQAEYRVGVEGDIDLARRPEVVGVSVEHDEPGIRRGGHLGSPAGDEPGADGHHHVTVGQDLPAGQEVQRQRVPVGQAAPAVGTHHHRGVEQFRQGLEFDTGVG